MKSPDKEKGMGVIFWTLVVGAGAAGYLMYRKLSDLEKEIRREILDVEEKGTSRKPQGSEPMKARTPDPVEVPVSDSSTSVVDEEKRDEENAPLPEIIIGEIMDRVKKTPGILQTDVYPLYPDENRRHLQDILLRMDREGRIRREKEGSTYRLFKTGE